MKLLSVDNKKSPITAKIELDCEVKGTIKRKAVTVRQGDDLSEKLSGYREVYNGYVVDDIYCEKGNEYVSFTTKPEFLRIGEAVDESAYNLIMRDNGLNKLYFVVETKGSIEGKDLRPKEQAKIRCGEKHFAALGNDAKFVKADGFQRFVERVV